MFQEVLQMIATSPNPHRWPSSSYQTYWFGYFTSDDENEMPTVLPAGKEATTPISEVLKMNTSKLTGDLILIPQTQIGPVCEKCCQGCTLCPPIT
jgi:hypothetical protein